MISNYFFIDGPALISQVRELQKENKKYRGHKLNPLELVLHFSINLPELGSQEYKRAVFYFAKDDPQVKEFLSMTDRKKPGLVKDIHFKYCGKKLPRSKAYDVFLSKVPQIYRDSFTKSEKGVDTEICCDALQLSATGKMERLFLLTNDSDFVPLCKRLKDFGTNISLIRLSNATKVNKELVDECDTYDIVKDTSLPLIFNLPPEPLKEQIVSAEPSGQEIK